MSSSGAERAAPGMSPVAEELLRRNHWLIGVRWLAVAGMVITIEVGRRLLTLEVPPIRLHCLAVFIALYNVLLWRYSRRALPAAVELPGEWRAPLANLLVPRTFQELGHEEALYHAVVFAMLQISLDLFSLSYLIHLTGGVENPLLYFFIFHVIIASILLSQRATYLLATIGYLLVSGAIAAEYLGWLPHHHVGGLGPGESAADPVFIFIRLAALGVTLYLSTWLCSNIAVHLRGREREILRLSADLSLRAGELEAAYRQVSESERTKSRYMRKVAHELQGPLGTIQTTLMAVLQGLSGSIPETTRELVSRSCRRAEELRLVTRDLLALSRARERGPASAPEPARLDRVAADVAGELAPEAAAAGVALAFEPPAGGDAAAGDPEVFVVASPDPLGLRQLVQNLVSNAIRYTPRGGRIDLRLARRRSELVLEVEDTGIGIEPEDAEHIFDEFYRARAAREFAPQGTGLGLAIVKAIAGQHGGRVAVASEPGHGSRFTVTFPALSAIGAGGH